MRKLVAIVGLVVALATSFAFAETTKTIFNPFTGRFDFITSLNGDAWPTSGASSGFCLTTDGSGHLSWASCSSGGGSSASSLELFMPSIRSSPTASVSLEPNDFGGLVRGTTFYFSLNPATTDFIHNQTGSQSATFSVTSGTVNNLTVSSFTIHNPPNIMAQVFSDGYGDVLDLYQNQFAGNYGDFINYRQAGVVIWKAGTDMFTYTCSDAVSTCAKQPYILKGRALMPAFSFDQDNHLAAGQTWTPSVNYSYFSGNMAIGNGVDYATAPINGLWVTGHVITGSTNTWSMNTTAQMQVLGSSLDTYSFFVSTSVETRDLAVSTSGVVFGNIVKVSSNTVLPGTTFYQNGNVTEGINGRQVKFSGDVNVSSGMWLNGTAGSNGQFLTSGGANTTPAWTDRLEFKPSLSTGTIGTLNIGTQSDLAASGSANLSGSTLNVGKISLSTGIVGTLDLAANSNLAASGSANLSGATVNVGKISLSTGIVGTLDLAANSGLAASGSANLSGSTINVGKISLSTGVVGVLPIANGGDSGEFKVSLTTGVIGTVQAANFLALTGDITNTVGTVATTLATMIANAHTFNGAITLGGAANAVTISSNVITPGATIYQNGTTWLNPNTFTASLPLQTDSAQKMVSLAIDLGTSQAGGTLAAARMPALTGDTTSQAGSLTTVLNTTVPGNHTFTGAIIISSVQFSTITYLPDASVRMSTGTPLTLAADGVMVSSTGVNKWVFTTTTPKWTAPSWARFLRIRTCAGSGGASGAQGGAAGSLRVGGSGGGGGACPEDILDISAISGSNFGVIVGTAGTGGPAGTVGTRGMDSSFYAVGGATYTYAGGGSGGGFTASSASVGGLGGSNCGPGPNPTNAASAAGGCPSISATVGFGNVGAGAVLGSLGLGSDYGGASGAGGTTQPSSNLNGGSSFHGGPGGGASSACTAANVCGTGGDGGSSRAGGPNALLGAPNYNGGGGLHGTSGGSCTAGANGAAGNENQAGTAGGSGGGNSAGTGCTGGTGGTPSGAGGAGGPGTTTGGAGGNGAPGAVYIYAW